MFLCVIVSITDYATILVKLNGHQLIHFQQLLRMLRLERIGSRGLIPAVGHYWLIFKQIFYSTLKNVDSLTVK